MCSGEGIYCTHNNDTNLSPQGRQFDQHGNIDPWWDSSSLQKFQNKAQCIIGRTQVRFGIFIVYSLYSYYIDYSILLFAFHNIILFRSIWKLQSRRGRCVFKWNQYSGRKYSR